MSLVIHSRRFSPSTEFCLLLSSTYCSRILKALITKGAKHLRPPYLPFKYSYLMMPLLNFFYLHKLARYSFLKLYCATLVWHFVVKLHNDTSKTLLFLANVMQHFLCSGNWFRLTRFQHILAKVRQIIIHKLFQCEFFAI